MFLVDAFNKINSVKRIEETEVGNKFLPALFSCLMYFLLYIHLTLTTSLESPNLVLILASKGKGVSKESHIVHLLERQMGLPATNHSQSTTYGYRQKGIWKEAREKKRNETIYFSFMTLNNSRHEKPEE